MKVIAPHSHAGAWQRVIKHVLVGLKTYIVGLKTYSVGLKTDLHYRAIVNFGTNM